MENIEKLSRAVSLSIFDIFSDMDTILPAYFIAGLISDEVWSIKYKHKQQKTERLTPFSGNKELRNLPRRINDLQVYMNQFGFTTIDDKIYFSENEELKNLYKPINDLQTTYMNHLGFTDDKIYPGGDPWGLVSFEEEKLRLGYKFVEDLRINIFKELERMTNYDPDGQFTKILNELYYEKGYYPRFRNELIEVMNELKVEAERRGWKDKEKKEEKIIKTIVGSGKCIALLMAAMATALAYFKIYENICIIFSKSHVIAFIESDEYFIWNNWHLIKSNDWYINNTTPERNKIIKDIIPKLENEKQDIFFYPAYGICNFEKGFSNVKESRVMNTISKLEQFVGNGIRVEYQQNDSMQWLEEKSNFIPNVLNDNNEYKSPEDYRKEIYDLAEKNPFSIYDYAKYAYRDINVKYPQAYIVAAKRDCFTKEKSQNIKSLDDTFNIIKNISSDESIFKSRDRIALPDEVLIFNKGNDRDRALLLYCLLSNLTNEVSSELFICFSQNKSYVKYGNSWIDLMTLKSSDEQPPDLQIIFNETDKLL